MCNPSNTPSATAQRFAPLALLLLGLSGCGNGSSAPAPVVNLPPVASNACPAILDSSGSVAVTLPATDPNGAGTIVSYTIDSLPSNGSITGCSIVPCSVGINVTYVPYPNSTGKRGMDKFTFHVTDSGGLSSSAATVWILNNGMVRIMPLGDSITRGSAGDPNVAGYRRRLFQQLETVVGTGHVNFVGGLTDGSPDDFGRNHEGHGGWCDDAPCSGGFGNINDSVLGFLDGSPADVILLHIGTNDFDVSPAGVDGILFNINTWAQQNYPVNAFVARIIQTSQLNGTPSNADITTFNDNVESVATDRSFTKVFKVDQQTGATLVYTIDASATCLNGGTCTGDLADDLHPNPRGYGKMADKWMTNLTTSGVLPNCP